MSEDAEEFWAALPEKAVHPNRVPMLEALRWIDVSVSSIELVNVLDGLMTMWEVAHHLRVLEALDVVEPAPGASGNGGTESFDVLYRLKGKSGR